MPFAFSGAQQIVVGTILSRYPLEAVALNGVLSGDFQFALFYRQIFAVAGQTTDGFLITCSPLQSVLASFLSDSFLRAVHRTVEIEYIFIYVNICMNI